MLPYEQQLNEIICAKNIILSTLDFGKEKNIVYEDDETDKFDSNELKIGIEFDGFLIADIEATDIWIAFLSLLAEGHWRHLWSEAF